MAKRSTWWEGRVVVVTGSSSGIGEALAREVARRGASVGLTARRGELLERLAGELQAEGHTVVWSAADALDPVASAAALQDLRQRLGSFDVFVANAGLGLATPAIGFTAGTFERMVQVNLFAVSRGMETVLPEMLARGAGRIVGISSLAGYRGLPDFSGYSASKAGVTALLEGLRAELRPRGVEVVVVHPGYVRTPMIEHANRPLPFVVDVGRAARIIADGIERGRRRIDFPWPMTWLAGLGRLLPAALYDTLIVKLLPKDSKVESSFY